MSEDIGKIIVIAGTSQYGKSGLFDRLMKEEKRLVVYDPKCHPKDYPGITEFKTIHGIAERMLDAEGSAFRGRFCDAKARDFHLFCEAALDWGKRFGRCVIGLDELAEVTHAGKAMDAYGTLLRTGKGFGVDIVVLSQALCESDKTCLRNSDVKICFYLGHIDDRQYMAKQMGIKPEQIERLPRFQCIVKEHLKEPYLLDTSTLKESPLPD